MRTLLKISDAAVIAIHAVDRMGGNRDRLHSASGMARALGVSYNHLSKVMQRLTKAGFVSPLRGPKGGFAVTKKAGRATYMDIIEAIEGPLLFSDCLMRTRVCGRTNCAISRLLTETNRKFEKVLSQKVMG
jgi:Rrf2 family protein